MYAPSYKLDIVYEVSPSNTRKVFATTPTQTWTVTDLRCAVTTKSTSDKNPNQAEIKLWNVAPTSLAKMTALGDVVLSAGYQDEGLGVIFRGNVLEVITKKEVDGSVTTLRCADGGRAHSLASTSVSFATNSTFPQIANKLLDNVLAETGLGVGNARLMIAQASATLYRRGYSDSGSALRCLATLLQGAGLALSVQGMTLQVVKSNTPIEGPVYELASDSGLIGSPDLAGSMTDTTNTTSTDIKAVNKAKAKQKMIKVSCFLLPNIKINQQVHITSKAKTGYYTVNSIAHKFDSRGSDVWRTDLEVIQ